MLEVTRSDIVTYEQQRGRMKSKNGFQSTVFVIGCS